MRLDALLNELGSAEEFFEFFGVPYDQDAIKPVRLHALGRFREYKRQIDACHSGAPIEKIFEWYGEALARAYKDSLEGTPGFQRESRTADRNGCSCRGGCHMIQGGAFEEAG